VQEAAAALQAAACRLLLPQALLPRWKSWVDVAEARWGLAQAQVAMLVEPVV
jgi:hypothetical protein